MKRPTLRSLAAKASRYLATAALDIEDQYPQRAAIMQDLSKTLNRTLRGRSRKG